MALTKTQLTTEMQRLGALQANHIVAYIDGIVNGVMDITTAELEALKTAKNALMDLLDGDNATEGFQNFLALTSKVNAIELKGNDNAANIAALQALLTTTSEELTAQIEGVDTAAANARAEITARIDAHIAAYEVFKADRIAKQSATDAAIAEQQAKIEALEAKRLLNEARISTLETDNTANKAAIAGLRADLTATVDALNAQIAAEQEHKAELESSIASLAARVTDEEAKSATFVTRQEMADSKKAFATSFVGSLWAGKTQPAGLTQP